MRTLFRKWWQTAAFLALALIVLGFVMNSRGFHACVGVREQEPYLPSERGVPFFVVSRSTCVVQVADRHNGVLVALFTLTLWGATQATLTHLHGSSRRELRAYLGTSLGLGRPHGLTKKSGSPFYTDVIISNFGKTPARNGRFAGWCKVLDADLPTNFDFPSGLPGEQVGPFSCYPGPHGILVRPIRSDTYAADDTIAAVQSGTLKRLYVYGTVTYDDVFGDTHKTRFCGYYDQSRPYHWVSYKERNDGD